MNFEQMKESLRHDAKIQETIDMAKKHHMDMAKHFVELFGTQIGNVNLGNPYIVLQLSEFHVMAAEFLSELLKQFPEPCEQSKRIYKESRVAINFEAKHDKN